LKLEIKAIILITFERLLVLEGKKGLIPPNPELLYQFLCLSSVSYHASPGFEITSGFVYVFLTGPSSFFRCPVHGLRQADDMTSLARNPSLKKRKCFHLEMLSPGDETRI